MDSEVLYGLCETIEKNFPNKRIKFQLDEQHDRFKKKHKDCLEEA